MANAEPYLKNLNGTWYYRRRVPKHQQGLDNRGHIRRSTKQTDYTRALSIAQRIHNETEKYWTALELGEDETALSHAKMLRLESNR